MNKDLPIKVRHIFSELDPVIWKGVWLSTLNSLLSSSDMIVIWEQLVKQASSNKKNYPSIGNAQFIKWELKAFVAQAVTLVNKNYNRTVFISKFETFLSTKGYNFNKDVITKIYESIYN
tara:strand:+ start:86 stop:442 length:357 start_codon:yes stop_codon:yes gene_type:complete